MERLFAVTAPGLEKFTRQELIQAGILPLDGGSQPGLPGAHDMPLAGQEDAGGIEFEGDLPAIYQANLRLRTASRIILRLGSFYAAAFSELEKKSSRLNWGKYLSAGRPVALRVTCHKSRLYHSAAVARTIIKGIGRCMGRSPEEVKFDENSPTSPAQLIIVRLANDLCSISVDTSGAGLHRRGYRLATAKAPLRETLGAGMILASGWDGVSPLIDPFCGSGTIPIEAALLARGIPPGISRRFAFMDWPNYDPALWKTILADARVKVRVGCPPILGSDRDAGAIKMAGDNAERAGVADCIDFTCRAVSAIEPPGTGWVVTNPPYGVRVRSSRDMRNLYAQFGKVLRQKCPDWHVAVLSSDRQLLGNIGLPLTADLTLVNGGLRVMLAQGIVKD